MRKSCRLRGWLVIFAVVLAHFVSGVAAATATVTTGAQLARAFLSPDVDTALIDVENLVLSHGDFDNASALPIPLARNFSILGAWQPRAGRYPYMDFAYVRSKVRLAPGVTLGIHRLLVRRTRSDPSWRGPGLDLITDDSGRDPSNAAAFALVDISDGINLQEICLPPAYVALSLGGLTWPTELPPAKQSGYAFNATQQLHPNCSSGSTNATSNVDLPYEQQCILSGGMYMNLGLYCYSIDAYGNQVKTGYVSVIRNSEFQCYQKMTVECLASHGGIVGCHNYMTKLMSDGANATNSITVGSGQQPSPAAAAASPSAPPGAGSPLLNNSSGATSQPALGAGGGGDSSGSSNTPMVVGAVVGSVLGGLLLLAAVAVLLLRHRRRRQQQEAGDAAAAAAAAGLSAAAVAAPNGKGGGGAAAGVVLQLGSACGGSGGGSSHVCGGGYQHADQQPPDALRSAASMHSLLAVSGATAVTAAAAAAATSSGDNVQQSRAHRARDTAMVPVTALTPLNADIPLNVATTTLTSLSSAAGGVAVGNGDSASSGLDEGTPPGTLEQRLGPHVTLFPSQVIGKGSFGKVVEGLYGGRRVAVKLIDTGLLLPAATGRATKRPQAPQPAAWAYLSKVGDGSTADGLAPAPAPAPAAMLGAAAAEAAFLPPLSESQQEQQQQQQEQDEEEEEEERVTAGKPPCTLRAVETAGCIETLQPQQNACELGSGNSAGGEEVRGLISALGQEVEVLARVRHENIVCLLAANLSPPHVCLVMERMDTSLDRLLYKDPDRPLPLSLALHIALQVARALQYLHPTVLHRDLKPANVLISHADAGDESLVVAKLADFGLARLRNTVLVTCNPEVGTAPYMAPECFDLDNGTITDRADCYSFGVLLWELLTRRRPWEGLAMVAIAVRVAVRGERLPLAVLDQQSGVHVPAKVVRLVQQCFEVDPRRRPAAAEMVKTILLALEELRLGSEAGLGEMLGFSGYSSSVS